MKVLGIESSCDETAVAIVDENKNILSNVVVSQIDIHKEYALIGCGNLGCSTDLSGKKGK